MLGNSVVEAELALASYATIPIWSGSPIVRKFYQGPDSFKDASKSKALCSTKIVMHEDTYFGWSERHCDGEGRFETRQLRQRGVVYFESSNKKSCSTD